MADLEEQADTARTELTKAHADKDSMEVALKGVEAELAEVRAAHKAVQDKKQELEKDLAQRGEALAAAEAAAAKARSEREAAAAAAAAEAQAAQDAAAVKARRIEKQLDSKEREVRLLFYGTLVMPMASCQCCSLIQCCQCCACDCAQDCINCNVEDSAHTAGQRLKNACSNTVVCR